MNDARTEPDRTSTTAPDLATWLLAQIAEDEQDAEMARQWRGRDTWRNDIDGSPEDTHIARHSPARVLAECDAKRRILELHPTNKQEPYRAQVPGGVFYPPDPYYCDCQSEDGLIYGHEPCPTKRLLALPYADRDGYREEWKP